jgi:proliferating cell nuclear antigen PCNA
MVKILELKTLDIHTFKILFEGLKEIAGEINFIFDRNGLRIKKIDNSQSVLIDMELKAENFEQYTCSEPLKIGLTMINLYKVIKTCVNSNILTIFYDDEMPDILNMVVENEEAQSISHNRLNSIEINLNNHTIDQGELTTIVYIPTNDFQKLIKDASQFNEEIEIQVQNNNLIFKTSDEYTIHETIKKGDYKPENNNKEITSRIYFTKISPSFVSNKYDLRFLLKFIKFSNLCKYLKMNISKDSKSIKFSYDVGNLGTISFYLMSKFIEN